jgi:serine-type D-Ala-D-Ala carboxypeptidase (penicillin-binding protein 5/6)
LTDALLRQAGPAVLREFRTHLDVTEAFPTPPAGGAGARLASEILPATVEAPAVVQPACADIVEPAIGASAWALYDSSTSRFLGGENEHDQRFPASLTKIATAIVVLREGALGGVVAITDEWWRPSSQAIGLPLGARVETQALFTAMLTISANDAASELASEIAGSERRFARLMNQLAAELGLEDTNFRNPHGLDEPGHYSSAHDLALLSAEAMSELEFREVVGQTESDITIGSTPGTSTTQIACSTGTPARPA